MKKTVSVSQLASYCANEIEFINLKGGVINKRAAAAGTNAHNEIGKSYKKVILLILFLLGLVGALCIHIFYFPLV